MYLNSIRSRDAATRSDAFPWSISALRTLSELEFPSSVTFLVGDNGSGKSTLLEGLAYGMGAYAVGSVGSVNRDPLLAHAKSVADAFYFVRRRSAKIKMFLRAEDVFGHVKAELDEANELEQDAEEIRRNNGTQTTASMLWGMAQRIRASDPDGRSHGETFLKILETRLHGGGLYFLDEPESPLSPARQLALLYLIRDRASDGAQFIIATHSPVILAIPEATIYRISDGGIDRIEYDKVENVAFMRRFLLDPSAFVDQ